MILAKDVMTADVTTIGEDEPVRKVVQTIRKTSFSGFPVVDKAGRAVGMISQNDILHALSWAAESGALTRVFRAGKRGAGTKRLRGKGKFDVEKLLEKPVKELMTSGVLQCGPDAPAAEICETMVSKKIHRLVVLDEDRKVLGLISSTDLVRKFGEQLRGAKALFDV